MSARLCRSPLRSTLNNRTHLTLSWLGGGRVPLNSVHSIGGEYFVPGLIKQRATPFEVRVLQFQCRPPRAHPPTGSTSCRRQGPGTAAAPCGPPRPVADGRDRRVWPALGTPWGPSSRGGKRRATMRGGDRRPVAPSPIPPRGESGLGQRRKVQRDPTFSSYHSPKPQVRSEAA